MKKIIALFVVLASISTANAADKEWSFGGLIGYGTSTGFSGLTYGAEIDYAFTPGWTAGIYWSMTKEGGVTAMPIMLDVNYWFADVKGLYVGPRLGIISSKTEVTVLTTTVSSSSSNFAFGAQAGYDMDLSADWSVGINANWNLSTASGASSFFNFVVPIKFHF